MLNQYWNALLYASASVAILGLLLHWFRPWISPRWGYWFSVALAVRLLLPVPAPWPTIELPAGWAWAVIGVIFGGAVSMWIAGFFRTALLRQVLQRTEQLLPAELHREYLAAKELSGSPLCPVLVVSGTHIPPLTVGIGRPMIAVPAMLLPGMEKEHLRDIMLHELSHLVLHDLWFGVLWQLARGLHWFNPLLAVAAGDFRRIRELRCDARVLQLLSSEAERSCYGQMLLELNQRLAAGSPYREGAASILESPSLLAERIARIAVGPGRYSGRYWRSAALATGLLLTLVPRLAAATELPQPYQNILPQWRVTEARELTSGTEWEEYRQRCGAGLTAYTRECLTGPGGRVEIVVFEFGSEADAAAYWNVRQMQTSNLHLHSGNRDIEIIGNDIAVLLTLWDYYKPDPALDEIVRLMGEGIAFTKVNLILEPMYSQIASRLGVKPRCIYNAFSSAGQLNFVVLNPEADDAREVGAKMQVLGVPEENILYPVSGLVVEYIHFGAASEVQQRVRQLLTPQAQ